MREETRRRRIAAFDAGELARTLGLRIVEAGDGHSRVRMPATGKKNSNGVLHGGAVFTLADHAFGIAANTGPVNRVAVSATIRYVAPATGDLEAVADRVGESGAFSMYRVMVTQDGGRLIALFDGVAIGTGEDPTSRRDP